MAAAAAALAASLTSRAHMCYGQLLRGQMLFNNNSVPSVGDDGAVVQKEKVCMLLLLVQQMPSSTKLRESGAAQATERRKRGKER